MQSVALETDTISHRSKKVSRNAHSQSDNLLNLWMLQWCSRVARWSVIEPLRCVRDHITINFSWSNQRTKREERIKTIGIKFRNKDVGGEEDEREEEEEESGTPVTPPTALSRIFRFHQARGCTEKSANQWWKMDHMTPFLFFRLTHCRLHAYTRKLAISKMKKPKKSDTKKRFKRIKSGEENFKFSGTPHPRLSHKYIRPCYTFVYVMIRDDASALVFDRDRKRSRSSEKCHLAISGKSLRYAPNRRPKA